MTEAQLLATTSGFMGVPWATSAAGAKAAILGVPFDCGTHAFRIASRAGAPRGPAQHWAGAAGVAAVGGAAGLRIVASDINTVSPPHDVSGMTAHLAAYIALEMLLL